MLVMQRINVDLFIYVELSGSKGERSLELIKVWAKANIGQVPTSPPIKCMMQNNKPKSGIFHHISL